MQSTKNSLPLVIIKIIKKKTICICILVRLVFSKLMVRVHKFKEQLSKVVSMNFKTSTGVLQLTLGIMNK